jgi:transcriptional regulator with PAS, ATPase and Fis domain
VLRKLFVRGSEGQLITLNKRMNEAIDLASRVANSDVPVFIEGESVTGKELIAQHIHNVSSQAQNKFIKVNCAALPSELLESELFGHVRGNRMFVSCQPPIEIWMKLSRKKISEM